MSDNESGDELDLVSDSLQKIHVQMEELSHNSKQLYSRALRIQHLTDNPELDLWVEPFRLHDRAHKWAKIQLVPRKCSLWQIHQTLLESAKKDKRAFSGQEVKLTEEEATIMDLPFDAPVSVWLVLGRLPRFFL